MTRNLTPEEREAAKEEEAEQMATMYRCDACGQDFVFARLTAKGCPHCGKYAGFQRLGSDIGTA